MNCGSTGCRSASALLHQDGPLPVDRSFSSASSAGFLVSEGLFVILQARLYGEHARAAQIPRPRRDLGGTFNAARYGIKDVRREEPELHAK